jgi:hypothetical protein
LDGKDGFIKVFSATGDYLRKMAGMGEGPGEFKRLGEFGFTSDNRLFFIEMMYGHKWITFLHLSGKLDKVIKLKLDGQFGVWRAIGLPDNRLLAEIHRTGEVVKTGKYYRLYYPRQLVIINPIGEIENVLIKKNDVFSISNGPSMPSKRIPFFPKFLWGRDKMDSKIIFSEGNSNILTFYDLEGNITKQKDMKIPDAIDVTSEDMNRWREEFKKKFLKEVSSEGFKKYYSMIYDYKESIYKKKPFLCHLNVTNEGNIFIRECPQGDEGNKVSRYWLLDQHGEELYQFTSKANLCGISTHFVYCVIEDDDGNAQVYLMKRSKGEKEDLLLFLDNLGIKRM